MNFKHRNWREAYEHANKDLIERFSEGEIVEHVEFGEGCVTGYSRHYPINNDPSYRSVVVDFGEGNQFIPEDELDKMKVIC